MAEVISYRPRIGKQRLERLIKDRLHYKNLNQFIDHAVNRTLDEEMGGDPVAKKIAREVEKAVYKHLPLKFTKPTRAEAEGIEAAVKKADRKGGWISAEELIRKHRIR